LHTHEDVESLGSEVGGETASGASEEWIRCIKQRLAGDGSTHCGTGVIPPRTNSSGQEVSDSAPAEPYQRTTSGEDSVIDTKP
jgi:hypothetical protein